MVKKLLTILMLYSVIASGAQSLHLEEGGRPVTAAGSPVASAVLTGKVLHAETKAPLEGAIIYLPDLKLGANSNAAGEYRIQNIPEGRYVIEVSFQGFGSVTTTLSVQGITEQDFVLVPAVVESENVLVTGVSKATEIRRATVPVSVMRKQELYKSTAGNIIEALTRKSGVSALTTGPAIAKPFIRGLGYNRVITLNNGVRQEGQQWGDEHGIEIDEYSVQKAEVLRGPSSLMYGSDGIGGVLNIINNVPAPEGRLLANVVMSHNANNGLWGTHANFAGKANGVSFSGYGSHKSAGDYENKYDGKVLNSRFRETDFGATLGVNRQWGYSHLSVSNFDQKAGIIEGDRNDEGQFLLYPGTSDEMVASADVLEGRETLIPYQRIRHFKVISDNSFSFGKNRLSAVLGWQHNQRQEFGDHEEPETPEAFFDLQTMNYNLGWHFAEKNSWKNTIGLSGMWQVNTNKGEEAIIPDYDLLDAGVYLFSQKALGEKTNLSGGLRVDNRSMQVREMTDENGKPKFEAFDRQFTNLSASIGISYLPSEKVTLKANLSRGFRAPNASELSANGEHEGTNRYEIGRSDLESETSLQADLSAEVNTDHISLSFTPFYNRISNYIFFEKLLAMGGGDSLSLNEEGELITTYKFNQQQASLAGLEFGFDIHPHPLDWLHVENTVSLVQGSFANEVDGTRHLPMIAPVRWISEFRAEFDKMGGAGILRNTYFKVEADANGAQNRAFTAYGTETATDGFVLVNAGLGTDIRSRKQKTIASFHLSLNNLTDVGYQNHMSRLKYTAENAVTGRQGVFNMGRNFTARLIIPMNFSLAGKD